MKALPFSSFILICGLQPVGMRPSPYSHITHMSTLYAFKFHMWDFIFNGFLIFVAFFLFFFFFFSYSNSNLIYLLFHAWHRIESICSATDLFFWHSRCAFTSIDVRQTIIMSHKLSVVSKWDIYIIIIIVAMCVRISQLCVCVSFSLNIGQILNVVAVLFYSNLFDEKSQPRTRCEARIPNTSKSYRIVHSCRRKKIAIRNLFILHNSIYRLIFLFFSIACLIKVKNEYFIVMQ